MSCLLICFSLGAGPSSLGANWEFFLEPSSLPLSHLYLSFFLLSAHEMNNVTSKLRQRAFVQWCHWSLFQIDWFCEDLVQAFGLRVFGIVCSVKFSTVFSAYLWFLVHLRLTIIVENKTWSFTILVGYSKIKLGPLPFSVLFFIHVCMYIPTFINGLTLCTVWSVLMFFSVTLLN